jgi:hypothetical protein
MHGADPTQRKYRGVLQSLLLVTREEGVRGLWRGNLANVLRVIPVYALKFSFNDRIKHVVARGDPSRQLSYGELMLSGTLAGLMQTCITYPLETVRTRLSYQASH